MLGMPTAREQFDQVLRLASMSSTSADRVALLQTALTMLNEHTAGVSGSELTALRASIETRVRDDLAIDRRYSQLVQRMSSRAAREAGRARITGVERVLTRIAREDEKLGKQRPDVVEALHASVQASLTDARRLRLLRDQWVLRQAIYRDYQRLVGSQLLNLVRAQPMLESIRRLDGPPLSTLKGLQSRLSGGAERLSRMPVPEELKDTHDLLVGAWRFAENAANGRSAAIASGNVARAWEASSAAAGALMLLSRVQQGIQDLLELPRLQ
jgi:hypothetical protein